jgi:hypothetical protein
MTARMVAKGYHSAAIPPYPGTLYRAKGLIVLK